jgi:Flp pilus assembly pilin Flp
MRLDPDMDTQAEQKIAEPREISDAQSAIRNPRSAMGGLLSDEQGAATLEWALLLAAIGVPACYVIGKAMDALVWNYQMMTLINSLPFP